MIINLDEKALKRASANMNDAAKKIQEDMIKIAIFGDGSAPALTTRIDDSITKRPLEFYLSRPVFDVIISSWIVEIKKMSREKKRNFWRRLWDGLTDHNLWPYSRIEYIEGEVPSFIIDRVNKTILCHPAFERDIKKAIR